jgi:homeodomain interacting protein kinase
VKYEQHATQKKRLLAMTQNDPNINNSSSQMKQEPTEFASSTAYEYPPYDHQKRSSWVGSSSSNAPSSSAIVQPPNAHQSHHLLSHSKRDSAGGGSNSGSQQQQQQPPVAHGKSEVPLSSSSTTTSLNSTPIFHHHHSNHHHHHRTQPQNTTPLGNSPTTTLLQTQQPDIYAQAEIYRRPTVFVSQASAYAYNARVIPPPPAHNPSNRQVRSTRNRAWRATF